MLDVADIQIHAGFFKCPPARRQFTKRNAVSLCVCQKHLVIYQPQLRSHMNKMRSVISMTHIECQHSNHKCHTMPSVSLLIVPILIFEHMSFAEYTMEVMQNLLRTDRFIKVYISRIFGNTAKYSLFHRLFRIWSRPGIWAQLNILIFSTKYLIQKCCMWLEKSGNLLCKNGFCGFQMVQFEHPGSYTPRCHSLL